MSKPKAVSLNIGNRVKGGLHQKKAPIEDRDGDLVFTPQDSYYNQLDIIRVNTSREVDAQIKIMLALKEIKDGDLYKFGSGDEKFDTWIDFINKYISVRHEIRKTQVYRYLSIAEGISSGVLTRDKVVELGLKKSEKIAKNKVFFTDDEERRSPGERQKRSTFIANFELPLELKEIYTQERSVLEKKIFDYLRNKLSQE